MSQEATRRIRSRRRRLRDRGRRSAYEGACVPPGVLAVNFNVHVSETETEKQTGEGRI